MAFWLKSVRAMSSALVLVRTTDGRTHARTIVTCTNNKKSKCSNDPYSPHSHDFYTVISLTYSTITNIRATSCTLTTEWQHKFWLPVTLWPWMIKVVQTGNQTIEYTSVEHHTKILSLDYCLCNRNLEWASTQLTIASYLKRYVLFWNVECSRVLFWDVFYLLCIYTV